MPRQSAIPAELRANLDSLKAARTAQRDANKDVRAARRVLAENARRRRALLVKAHERMRRMVLRGSVAILYRTLAEKLTVARRIHGTNFTECEQSIATHTAALQSAYIDLALFDQLHGLVKEPPPPVPTLNLEEPTPCLLNTTVAQRARS